MDKVELYVEKMEAQLKRWKARVDELVAKAEGTKADAKIEYHKRVDDLKAKCQAAQVKLDDLKTASGEKWKVLRSGLERAWDDIEAAFKQIKD